MISRAAAAAAIAAMLALPALAEMIKFTGTGAPSDFEFGRTGSGAPGAWTIVRDDSADGGLALEQQSQDRTDYRFPLAIYKAVSAKNVDVQVRFKAMSGNVDRAGGIAIRLVWGFSCQGGSAQHDRFFLIFSFLVPILLFDPVPRAFFLPDRIFPSPSRVAAVKDGTSSAPPKACP
jgi:hypothetical protein